MMKIEELKTMKGPQLIQLADELGVKVACDRKKNKLTEAKAKLIDRIVAFEAEQVKVVKEKEIRKPKTEMFSTNPISNKTYYHGFNSETTENAYNMVEENLVPMPGIEKLEELKNEYRLATPKRGALIEWDGKAQNICAWANELGISANTLYGRLYKLNWTIKKAFTTKGRK